MNTAVCTLHATICDCTPCRTTTKPSIKEPVTLMQIIGLAIEVASRNSLSKGCGRYVYIYLIIQLLTLHRKAIAPIPLSFSLAVFHSPIIYDFIPKNFSLYNSCNIYTCISSIVTRAFVVYYFWFAVRIPSSHYSDSTYTTCPISTFLSSFVAPGESCLPNSVRTSTLLVTCIHPGTLSDYSVPSHYSNRKNDSLLNLIATKYYSFSQTLTIGN